MKKDFCSSKPASLLAGKQIVQGVLSGMPIVLGYIPVACAFALIASNAGLSGAETMLMSLCIYAGAAQMMAAQMIQADAGFWIIVLSVFILNLRHLIMSTFVSHAFHPKSKWLRFACAYGVTDEVFALTSSDPEARSSRSAYYFLGAALAAYLSWLAGTAIGLSAVFLPEAISDSLAICLYAMFIALLVPSIRSRQSLIWLVLFSALLNTIFIQVMSSGAAMICASLIAAFAGTFFPENKTDSSPDLEQTDLDDGQTTAPEERFQKNSASGDGKEIHDVCKN